VGVASIASVYYDKLYFEFFDIGGQKPERVKWLYVVSEHDFSAIIYFVAMDEYDVPDDEQESPDKTKLELSRLIFKELVDGNSSIPSDLPIILFLNKMDRFQERLNDEQGIAGFKEKYKDFDGNSAEDAANFLQKMFLGTKNSSILNPVSAHQICVLDTTTMKVVWATVRDHILVEGLKAVGY